MTELDEKYKQLIKELSNKNLELESSGEGYAAMQSAVESAYAVGSIVIEEIISNWPEVKNTLPSKK